MSAPLQGLPGWAGFGLLGVALGLAHFKLLALNVRAYTAGAGLGRPLALHLLRLLGAGLAFWLLARQGEAALLGGLAGFLVARAISVRRAGRGG